MYSCQEEKLNWILRLWLALPYFVLINSQICAMKEFETGKHSSKLDSLIIEQILKLVWGMGRNLEM